MQVPGAYLIHAEMTCIAATEEGGSQDVHDCHYVLVVDWIEESESKQEDPAGSEGYCVEETHFVLLGVSEAALMYSIFSFTTHASLL